MGFSELLEFSEISEISTKNNQVALDYIVCHYHVKRPGLSIKIWRLKIDQFSYFYLNAFNCIIF